MHIAIKYRISNLDAERHESFRADNIQMTVYSAEKAVRDATKHDTGRPMPCVVTPPSYMADNWSRMSQT